MTSQIDPTLPVHGNPTTSSVRQNFQFAHDEITALQALTATPFLPLSGGTITGGLVVNGALDGRQQITTEFGFAFNDRTTPSETWEWYADGGKSYLWNNQGGGRTVLATNYADGNIEIGGGLKVDGDIAVHEILASFASTFLDRTTTTQEWTWFADNHTAFLWNNSTGPGIIPFAVHYTSGDAEFTGNVLFDKQMSVPTPRTSGAQGPTGPNAPGHIGSMWTNWGAKAHRVADRLFVGSDAFNITGNLITTGPNDSTDYISTLGMSFPLNATLVAHSPYGLVGAHFATKASLYNADATTTALAGHRMPHMGAWARAVGPLAVGGQALALAFTAVGLYDDVVNNNAGSVGYLEGRRYAGTLAGALGLEIDICNAGAVATSTPYDISAGGTITGALWLAAGGSDPTTFNHNASLALGFVPNNLKFEKAIVVDQNALDPAIGSGGNGTFLELAIGQGIRWVDSAGVVRGEMWASATAMHITPTPVVMSDVTSAMVSETIDASGDVPIPPGNGVFLIDTTSGPISLTLGSGLFVGQTLLFKDVAGHGRANSITLDASIDGGFSLTLSSDYASLALMWLGSLWGVV